MATYNSISDYYKKLDSVIISSLEKEGIAIMNYLKKIIEEDIYNTYEPFAYERTYELYDMMKMKVEKQNNLYTLVVYIDDKQHSYNPTWRYRKPSTYIEILEKFKKGFYGRDKGYDVMGEAKEYWEETGNAFKYLLNELKKKGITIK